VDDVVCTNINVLDMTGDKHSSKVIMSLEGIQTIIDKVKKEEKKGLLYQTTFLMKELVCYHAFASGNHRTAYIVGKTFLYMNGRKFKRNNLEKAYPFIKDIEHRSIQEIERWIKHGI